MKNAKKCHKISIFVIKCHKISYSDHRNSPLSHLEDLVLKKFFSFGVNPCGLSGQSIIELNMVSNLSGILGNLKYGLNVRKCWDFRELHARKSNLQGQIEIIILDFST